MPGGGPRSPVALTREPAAWIVVIVAVAAVAYTAGSAFGWSIASLPVLPGGASAILGAIVMASFAIEVARRRILRDLDRRIAALAVLAGFASLLATLTSIDDSGDPVPGVPGAVLAALLLVMYPFAAAGLVFLSRAAFDRGRRLTFAVDQGIVGWAGAMVMWHLLLYPLGRQAGASLSTMVLAAASPSIDLAMVVLAASLATRPMRGLSRPAAWLLVPAFGFQLVVDLWTAVETISGRHLGVLADVSQSWFWVVAAAILFLLHRPRRTSVDEAAASPPSLRWLPYGAIAVAVVVPAIVSWNDLAMLQQHLPASLLLVGLVLVRLAVTARQNEHLVAAAEAERTEARFHALVQHASDVVALTDVDSRVRYITPSAAKLFGTGPESLIGTRLTDLLHPDDAPRCLAELAEVAATDGSTSRREWRFRRSDDSWCDTEMTVSNMLDLADVGGLVFTGRDVSERKNLERQLTFQALHDPLTGLANRSLFNDRVEHALARSRRRPASVAVLFIDLDDFKRINDTHGHGIGDRLLVTAAARVSAVLRPGDTAARLGGDEFAVLLEDLATPEAARDVAERINESLRRPYSLDGLEAFVSASIGIAVEAAGQRGHEELLRDADVAMYVAKANGKRRCETFRPSMHEEVRDRLELEAELRHAVERGEFEVYYQPVWATATRLMVGVEALVRWNHPRRGLIAPGEFIGVAEDTGLILPIGRFVLREATAQIAEWDRGSGTCAGMSVAVNLSPRQLRDRQLVETVAAELAASGLSASRLHLEITESVLVEDDDEIVELLGRLKALGVSISIDDFGTGYSSLSYLRRLPVDALKIAKPFVDVLTNGAKDEALAQAVVALARSLELEVVAEGVEREGQLELLLRMGCELGQGFLISPPVPARLLPEVASSGAQSMAAARPSAA